MTYVIDDQAMFDQVLARLRIEARSENTPVGTPYVRDPEYPCDLFVPGTPGAGICYGDGHCMCYECRELDYDSPMIQQYVDLVEKYKIRQ